MKRLLLLFAFLLSVAAAACRSTPPPPPPGANERLDRLAEEYLNGYLAFRPTRASLLGVHHYDDRLPDYTPDAVNTEVLRVDGYLQLIASLPIGELDESHRVDLELLRAFMNAWRSRLTERPDFKRDPLFYNDRIVEGLEVLLRRRYAPPAKRMESLVERLRRIPDFLEVARVNLTEVPEVLRAAAAAPLVNTMLLLRDDLPERIRAQMNGDLPEGFAEAQIQAVYAYTDFILFVKDRLPAQIREDPAVGEEVFLERWSNEEFVNLSVDAVLEVCRTARKDVLDELKAAAALVDPEAEPAAVLRRLEEHPLSVKGITDAAARLGEALADFTRTEKLVTLPPAPAYRLRFLEADPRTNRVLSFLPPEMIEPISTTAYLSLNPVPPGCEGREREETLRFFNPFTILLYTAGAACPGRYAQYLAAAECDNLLHKTVHSATMLEGWSHYCRTLVVEKGFDARPEARLTRLWLDLLEINRLEVSARLHCRGMKVEDAIQFLVKESFVTPCTARREVEEIVRDCKAGAGFVGKAQIEKLRNLYFADSPEMNLADFHALLLSEAFVPVSVVARLVFGKQI